MYFARALVRLCSVVLLSSLVIVGGASCGDSETALPSAVLDVTPSVLSLVAGTSATVKATFTADGAATQDVTESATWASSAPGVATVAAGKVNAVAAGAATISVTSEGQTKTVAVTVTADNNPLVSLSVTPAAPTLPPGAKKQLVATGTYADSSTKDISSAVVWSSATSTVATVDPTGLLTSLAAGTSKITATLGTVTGSTEVTVIEVEVVSIAVTPGSPSIGAGATQAFTATATMTDNTTKDLTTLATWTSGTPTSASIANTGIAKGLAVGTSTITATFNGINGSTLLTVTEATLVSISLLPANATIPVGMKQNYFATGTFSDGSTEDLTETVAWSSGDPTHATISDAADSTKGEATAIAQGSAVITATYGAIMGSTTLTVSPAEVMLIRVTPIASSAVVGATRQYTATGEFTDGTFHDLTSVVAWASNNATVAPISTSGSTPGVALAVSPGRATISAKSGGAMGSAVLTVTP